MSSHIIRTSSLSNQNEDINHLLDIGNNSYNRDEKLDFLESIKKYPWILNIIKYSSESLYDTISKEKISISNKKLEQTIISVYKYLLRLSNRPTPNGYFGLSTLIDINEKNENKNKLKLIDKKHHIEISGHLIYAFYGFIINNIVLLKKLNINVNNILSLSNSNYILPVRGENPRASEDDYIIYNKNKVVDSIISLCNKKDYTTIDELSGLLVEQYEFKEQEAFHILYDLLNSRVLILDIYPEQLDILNFQHMVNKIHDLNPAFLQETEYYKINESIKSLIDNFDEEMFYKTRTYILDNLQIKNGIFINTEAIFNSSFINLDIADVISFVDIVSEMEDLPSMENLILDEYRTRFLDKYGYNIAVNVNHLFDEITGLGSPYRMNSLSMNSLRKKEKFEKGLRLQINRRNEDIYINDKLIKEIINDSTIKECCQKSVGLDISYKVYSDDKNTANIMLQSSPITYTPYAYRGRFQFLNKNSNVIDDITKLTYISHNNELWGVQASYQPTKNTININSNIYVYINNDGRFVIVDENSTHLSLSTMNMSNLNLKSEQVKFLETISSTNHNANYFISLLREIGLEENSQVYYNNVLLSVKSKHYKNLDEIITDGINFTLEKNDQYIPLNIENMLDKKIIDKEIKKNKGIWLSSPLVSSTYNNIIDYHNEELNCEIISTFIFKREHEENTLLAIKGKVDKPLFFNGEKGWIYMKIYLNKGLQNNFIINNLPDIIQKNKIWFFIRYEDPAPHIRLRIFIENIKHTENIFYTLDKLSNSDIINNYTFDVYYPEYERYGGVENFELVDNIFRLDSLLSINYIKTLEYDITNQDTKYIIENIVYLLERIDIPNKKILDILYDSEGMKDKNLRKKFDNVSSSNMTNISKDIDIEIIKNIVMIINELIHSVNDEKYSLSIINSLLHMHFNRLFGDNRIESDYRTFLYRVLKRKEFTERNV